VYPSRDVAASSVCTPVADVVNEYVLVAIAVATPLNPLSPATTSAMFVPLVIFVCWLPLVWLAEVAALPVLVAIVAELDSISLLELSSIGSFIWLLVSVGKLVWYLPSASVPVAGEVVASSAYWVPPPKLVIWVPLPSTISTAKGFEFVRLATVAFLLEVTPSLMAKLLADKDAPVFKTPPVLVKNSCCPVIVL
jgi:hypothetical protein